MPTSPAFWDRVAEKYDRKTVKGPNYAARLDRALAWLGPEASVLDVGCASGHITLDLAKRVQKVHGIDVSQKLVAIAQAKQAEQGVSNCSFAVTTLEDSDLEPGSLDAITAYSVLHLVPNAPATVRRFYELLQPGGRVIAETPTTDEINSFLRVLIKLMTAVGKAPTVRVFTPDEYESMFRDAGFVVDDVKVYNPKSMNRSLLATKPE